MNSGPQPPGGDPGEEAGPGAGQPLPGPGVPADEQAPAAAVPGSGEGGAGWFPRARLGFRDWRRSRPFWGGLLLVVAGLELLLIPLYSLLIHNAVKVVIYIGIGGVFGVVFGGLLIACGLLAWLHPVQRVFYAIVGALLAVGSFVVTNLGGFFVGMLLGVVGASLVFGWAPVQPHGGGHHRRRRKPAGQPQEPAGTLSDLLGDEPQGPPGRGGRLLVLPLVPLLLSGVLATGQALSGQPAMAPQGDCIFLIICLPSSSPSPSPVAGQASPLASGSASPQASPSPPATASPPASPSPSAPAPASPSPSAPAGATPAPSPSPARNANAGKRAAASTALEAASSPAILTAGSALMTGVSYDGVANVPTAGGPQAMLKFSMSTLSLSGGVTLTVTENGHTTVTRNTSIDFSGNVVLYATRICGDLGGVRVCFTPQDPPPLVLPTMTFTDVTTDQPLTTADSTSAGGLSITTS